MWYASELSRPTLNCFFFESVGLPDAANDLFVFILEFLYLLLELLELLGQVGALVSADPCALLLLFIIILHR